MSGAGSMRDMAQRIEQNRRQLRSKQDFNSRIKAGRQAVRLNKRPTIHREVPPEQLEKIKADISAKFKKEKKRNYLISILSLIIAVEIIILLIIFIRMYFFK